MPCLQVHLSHMNKHISVYSVNDQVVRWSIWHQKHSAYYWPDWEKLWLCPRVCSNSEWIEVLVLAKVYTSGSIIWVHQGERESMIPNCALKQKEQAAKNHVHWSHMNENTVETWCAKKLWAAVKIISMLLPIDHWFIVDFQKVKFCYL